MIAIKGQEMPDRCQDCNLCCDIKDGHGDYLYYCGALDTIPDLNKADVFFGTRPVFCPLVEVPDWNDVDHLLPPFGKEVLIYDADTGVHMGFLSRNGDWETDYCKLDNVTRWKQIVLPEK